MAIVKAILVVLHHHGMTRYPRLVLRKFDTWNRDDICGLEKLAHKLTRMHTKQRTEGAASN